MRSDTPHNTSARPSGLIPPGGSDIPAVRRTYLLDAVVERQQGARGVKGLLAEAAREVLAWFDEKVPGYLTDAMYELRSDLVDQQGLQTLTTIGGIEKGFWAGRLRYADRNRGDSPAVAGRTWTAEVVLIETAGTVRMGMQMFVATRRGVEFDVQYDRPELIPRLVRSFKLRSLLPITDKVPSLTAAQLVRLLADPDRRRSVVVLTPAEDPAAVFTHVLDQTEFGKQLLGIAWPATLSREQTYELRELIGKEWSVFGGAVRTYKPDLDFTNDEPRRHPLLMPDRIRDWQRAGKIGEEAVRLFLVEQCVRDLCDNRHPLSEGLSFDEIARRDIENRREAAANAELLPLALEEIESLRRELDVLSGRAEALRVDLEIAEEELEAERNQKASLLALNEKYLATIKERGIAAVRPNPTGYAEVEDWCASEFPGRLTLLPRAVRSLKDARFKSVELVAECLKILAHEGRDYLAGLPGGKQRFDERLGAIRVEDRGAITDTRAGEQGDEYYVRFPTHSDRKRKLERHLAKGNDHDAFNCLRIYYFWDEESQTIIVGDLPGHLRNRQT
ncbi:MAG TPA: hypothetical protein PLL78_03570 [Fimbriimonadaceae bacterium]|nr:hypothetical protein [Fimbriimonadaceae bacterium]HRJ95740.1 hypothetical protein [Fimbriimonadaceae bacterium]